MLVDVQLQCQKERKLVLPLYPRKIDRYTMVLLYSPKKALWQIGNRITTFAYGATVNRDGY